MTQESVAMQSIRAFVAINPTPAISGELFEHSLALQRAFMHSSLGWVPKQNLHITLKFLGNIPTSLLPGFIRCLQAELKTIAPFSIRFNSIQWFPEAQKPRFVVATFQPCSQLDRLAKQLDSIASQFGIPLETRPFRAHITLARHKKSVAGKTNKTLNIDISELSMAINQLCLLQSQTLQSGAVYSNRANFRLLS